jgi:hypothetical protein
VPGQWACQKISCHYTFFMGKRMGRPPLDPAEAKTELFQLRLTALERGEYQQAAERAEMTLSAWIRDRLTRAAKREAKQG